LAKNPALLSANVAVTAPFGGSTTDVALLVALAVPPALAAVTVASSVLPTSLAAGVYVEEVAPVICVHDDPWQSSHW
jgi:hypothetical protein